MARLSDAQVAQYHEDGYIVPDYQVSAEVLESIKARHAKLLEGHPEFRDYCPALFDYDLGFLDAAANADILDMVEQLIGGDFALWNMSFFAKPANDGKRTPWHQDGEYWPIRPLATCTVWLAVDDSTVENGCLRVIRGSHKDRALKRHNSVAAGDVTLTQELDKSEYDESKAVDIVLKAGQFSLHDVYLLHGSEANTSPKSRRGITMRFMPTTSVFDRQLAHEKAKAISSVDHATRQIFLMRGVDRSGKNTFENV